MVQTLRIVMASPSDTANERERFDRVVREVNEWVAEGLSLRLEPYRWETSVHPGFHPRGPQGLVDATLHIEDCHLLVGAFYKRFGTPGVDGKTGTEHEIETAERANRGKGTPHIKLWFRKVSSVRPDAEEMRQYQRVKDFRDRRKSRYLMNDYAKPEDFERSFRAALADHLLKAFPQHPRGHATAVAVSEPLIAAPSGRDWDSEELDRALDVYDNLVPRARAVLEDADAHETERRNALRLILGKGKLDDILAAFECSSRWPLALPQLRPEDAALLVRAARSVEDFLIGVFRLTATTSGRVQDALRCLRPLNSARIVVELMKALELLRGEPFATALQVLSEDYQRELKGCNEGLSRLMAAMRSGEYFEQSLKVAELVDGPKGVSMLENLAADFARAAERDSAMQERWSKLTEVLVKLRPPEFSSGESSESHIEASYTDLDRE